MNQVRLLRTLVVAEIILTVVAVAADFLLERFLPPTLQAYLASESDAPLRLHEIIFLSLGLPLLAALIVAWIGLVRFWKHAPILYLTTCMGLLVVLPFASPVVQTAAGAAVKTAASVVNGVILGLIYFSGLRERFAGPQISGSARD